MDRIMRYLILLPLFVFVLPVEQPQAQADSETVVSLAVPQIFGDVLNDDLFADFEAANPGVKVHLKTINEFGLPVSEQGEIEAYLDSMEAWVSAADVVMVDNNLTPEATRAGYFLDLSPLVGSDSALNVDDFYTGLWQSFQWDDGIWALPASGDTVMLFYHPPSFDEAGLNYPDASWTIDDLDNAIRTLTKFNDDGTVAQIAIQNFDGTTELALSLLGGGVYDDSVTPSVPRFDHPELENVLTTWLQLDQDGLLTLPGGTMIITEESTTPMIIARSAFAGFGQGLVPAPLPGGRNGITATGFAVSSGTRHPEAAYALVKFLTESPEIATRFFGNVPARRSLQGVQPENEGGVRFIGADRSPEMIAAIEEGLETGFPVSETRFANYLQTALNKMRDNDLDARTALQETELEVLDRLSKADERKATTAITVATPPPPPVVAEGETTLKLAVSSNIMPFPNEEVWQNAVDAFAASDPQVGLVEFEVVGGFNSDLETIAASYDCFYMPNNIVPNADLSQLRSLDPLLSGDPNYDPDDMVGNVMSLVQRDGQTWGFPAMIQPQAMRFNPTLFEQAGVPLPEGQWTVDEFESALRMLQSASGETPFVPRGFGNSHLVMLVAAYGGTLYDPITNQPNFTDPATVEAVRQVLTLAKDGMMDYQALAQTGGGGAMRIVIAGEEGSSPTALYTELLNGFGFGQLAVETEDGAVINPNKLVTFPQGSQYAAVSYDISAFYISAQSQQAEGCYRLIDTLTRNSELFPVMPVRRSQIPSLATTQGEDAVAFYTALDELMQQPETVILPTPFGGGTPATMMSQFWLNRAFDRYVLEDADLAAELEQAQQYTLEFNECAAAIPPFNPAENTDFQAFIQQYTDCAAQVDPTYGG